MDRCLFVIIVAVINTPKAKKFRQMCNAQLSRYGPTLIACYHCIKILYTRLLPITRLFKYQSLT